MTASRLGVLIRGAGDLATGVAHACHEAGYAVTLSIWE